MFNIQKLISLSVFHLYFKTTINISTKKINSQKTKPEKRQWFISCCCTWYDALTCILSHCGQEAAKMTRYFLLFYILFFFNMFHSRIYQFLILCPRPAFWVLTACHKRVAIFFFSHDKWMYYSLFLNTLKIVASQII